MKKFIFKLAVQDDKDKRKAMKIVSALPGIDEISIDMKGQKLTIIGTADPVSIVSKLRKFWTTDLVLVGPAKEPEKKEEPKKEETKKEEAKEEPKKEEAKKEEPKKEEPKKEEEKKPAPEQVTGTIMPYRPYYPGTVMPYRPYYPGTVMPYQPNYPGTVMPYRPNYPPMQTYYYPPNQSMEENPNAACVIL